MKDHLMKTASIIQICYLITTRLTMVDREELLGPAQAHQQRRWTGIGEGTVSTEKGQISNPVLDVNTLHASSVKLSRHN